MQTVTTENLLRLYDQLLTRTSRTRHPALPVSRLPLMLTLLDHYHFCFAYWAVINKTEMADSPSQWQK